MAKAFYELHIWQKGFELLQEVYKVSVKFPVEEKYSLTSQIKNSAISVISNIAESHGRYHFADKIRVLYIARGEVEETRSHLRIAKSQNYISDGEFEYLDVEYGGLSRGISSYIQVLSKKN
ncbi:MAG: four helix bundle protein [Elusimicrobia bacterium CG06_land_8_20_14_3_00_38_11]|nr:MAG: four helix bundle protein [Elusimicrobia bacterium CG06_land_8_20_14_3_00_38_11]